MKIFSALILLICLIGCTNTNNNNAQNIQEQSNGIEVSKDDISNLDYIEFVLDSKAEKDFETWAKYIELQNLITNLKQGDVSFFKDNPELFEAFLVDFKATIPEQINTSSILVRIKALETKMYKLQSVTNLSNTSKKTIHEAIKELLTAFSNLNLQINKKFEKESQNIEKPY